MTLEAPQRIDLADANSWDQIDDGLLTPEDKTLLREQFREDREGILYLTRQEISELSRIIETQRNSGISPVVRDAMTGELDAFIDNQIGLSLSDILGEENEQIQVVETLAANILFGEGAVLSGLNLSDRPQRYLTTSLSLSLIDYIHASENPVELLENPEEFLVEINDRLESLKTLANSTVGHRGIDMQARLNIEADGEQNTICMNVLEGKSFFNMVLAGELDAAGIERELEGANTQETIETPDLGELSRETRESVESILRLMQAQDRSGDIITGDTPLADVQRITAAPESERKTLFELLAELLKVFGEMFQSMIDNAASRLTDDSNTDIRGEGREDIISPEERNIVLSTIDFGHNSAILPQLERLSITNLESPSYEEILQVLGAEGSETITDENTYQIGYAVQSVLLELGYDTVGTVDAIVGENTQAALRRFQQTHSLEQTGEITRETLDALGSELRGRNQQEIETEIGV
ncbi:peptidoglycan-binding protein [Candidatus Gracilibacteria bacterium]|nr:peptidoglycan-binding protein [Candidatus Gracilibacteria bacterium]